MARAIPLMLLLPWAADACTTLAVGRKASVDGSVYVSHSNDADTGSDARLCWIPARAHGPGIQRPIYWDREVYPRFVAHGRGSCYEPKPGQKLDVPIGFIPEVNHTFGYYEANYGLLNEHGLSMGESTCSGIFGTDAVTKGGKALFSIDTLSRIAMERAKTAREAIQLMGSLAEKYGFYGVGSFEGSAESLMVGDPAEVYIFHILPDDSGTSAIWAAQRVPDDHVAVVANMFVIRVIDFSDSQNFLYSNSVKTVAQANGWWKPGEPLDFTKMFSDGEYASKFYSGRRMWGAYLKLGVDNLPDNYTDLRVDPVYPVTAAPPQPVHLADLFATHRFHYQGTKYDAAQGIAAGPWGDPDRYAVQTNLTGHWERTIGIYRASTTHVVQARSKGQGSVLWFSPHASPTSCFIPVVTTSQRVPAAYAVADPDALSRASAYWAHLYVAQVAKLRYSSAIKLVNSQQSFFEEAGQALVARLDKDPGHSAADEYERHAQKVVQAFWALPDEIVTKFADGWGDDKVALGYPDWWLKAVGYQSGPPPPPPNNPNSHHHPPKQTLCGDDATRACIAACPADGFARCAAACSMACGPSEVVV